MGSKIGSTYSPILSVWKPVLATFYFTFLGVFKFGVPRLAQKYSIYSEEIHNVTTLVCTMAVIHILILVLYFVSIYTAEDDVIFGFCFVAMTVIGSLLGLSGMSKTNSIGLPSQSEALSMARDYIQLHEKAPIWLYHTQLSHRCCGIYGFKDYRAFLYNGNHDKFKEDVPPSCCRDSIQARISECSIQEAEEEQEQTGHSLKDGKYEEKRHQSGPINQNPETNGITDIFSRPEGLLQTEWLKSLNQLYPDDELAKKLYPSSSVLSKSGKNQNQQQQHNPQKSQSSLNPEVLEKFHSWALLLEVNEKKAGFYNSAGCFPRLMEQTKKLILVYIIFLLCTTFASWALLIQFLSRNDTTSSYFSRPQPPKYKPKRMAFRQGRKKGLEWL